MVLSILSPHGVFAFLINASGAVMLFVYLIVALAQIASRRRLEVTQPERLRLKMWFFPWLSYAVVAAIVGILLAMALTPHLASQFYASVLSLTITLLAYALRRRAKPSRPLVGQSEPEDAESM